MIKMHQNKQYDEWVVNIKKALTKIIDDDLTECGVYPEDEIDSEGFFTDVQTVVEEMTKVLWDSYSDNIGDIVTEELGSDFRDTI
jgi:hypothetical protein